MPKDCKVELCFKKCKAVLCSLQSFCLRSSFSNNGMKMIMKDAFGTSHKWMMSMLSINSARILWFQLLCLAWQAGMHKFHHDFESAVKIGRRLAVVASSCPREGPLWCFGMCQVFLRCGRGWTSSEVEAKVFYGANSYTRHVAIQ